MRTRVSEAVDFGMGGGGVRLVCCVLLIKDHLGGTCNDGQTDREYNNNTLLHKNKDLSTSAFLQI